ncbi:MAG: delta-class carbonic anhydrase [Acidobacteriota bacterium]
MKTLRILGVVVCGLLLAAVAGAEICQGFGPQTPRDIDQKAGENARIFSFAPSHSQMNLCNIHFHNHAEHKAADYSIDAGPGDGGYGGGFQCNDTPKLAAKALRPVSDKVCKGIKPGDTIEVHWVFSSCDVTPGEGLGSCLSDACANPNLRVEAQVFLLVNDSDAADFADFIYGGNVVDGYHQPKAVPADTGDPVQFLGSTTGPSFDASKKCSPLQVSWSVRPRCAELDINSVHAWCKDNVFNEDHAHGVRVLVTDTRLLSAIE